MICSIFTNNFKRTNFSLLIRLQVVYTTVSVVLTLEVAEVSGRIRFGVTKGYSFASFLKDPLTRMNVTSEVGNDQFKLKNIPMLSDLIVKKIKSFIHNKIVYPSSHKMRLVWPRHWWPEGTEHMFESSDDVPREKQKSGFGSPVSGTPTTTTSTASALAGSVEGADATDHGKFITGATTVSKIASKDEVDCDKIRTDQRNSINKSRNGSVAQVSVKRKFSKWLNSYTGGTDKPLASHQQPSIDTMSAQDGGLKEFVNAASKKLGDTSEYEMDSDDEDIRADIENRRDSQMMHADSTDFQWDIVVSTAVTRFHQQLLHSIDKEKPALQTSDDVRIRDSNLQPTNRMPGAEALADLIALPGRKRSASWSHPCSRSQYFREIETILDSVNSFNKTGRERAHTITDFRCEVMEKYFIYLIYCKITGEVHASSEPSVSRNHGVSTQRNKTFEDDSVLTTKQWIKKMKRDQTRSVRKKIKNFKEKYLSKLKSSSKTSANATNKVSSLLDYSSDDSCGEIDRNTIAADVEEFRKLNELPSGVREQAMKHFIDKGNIEGIKRKESMDGRERRNSDTKDMGVVPTLMRRNSLEGYESNARRNSVSFGMGGDSAGAMRYVSSIFKTNKSETASDLDIAGTSAAKVVSPPKTMESRANQIFAKAFQVVRQRIDKDSNSSKTTDG